MSANPAYKTIHSCNIMFLKDIIKVMYEALIFNLPLKGCAKNKRAQNRGAQKLNARCAKFEVERKLSELRYSTLLVKQILFNFNFVLNWMHKKFHFKMLTSQEFMNFKLKLSFFLLPTVIKHNIPQPTRY